MEGTKILLSAEELSLVQDTHWLLTKNNIIEKTKALFGNLAGSLVKQTSRYQNHFPEAVHLYSPKVFKGEYYEGLPYVMLDYPRVFGKDDVFAIRTFFWWGNFFSITLQLKGSYHQRYLPLLLKHKGLLAEEGFHIAMSDDEWRHDFGPDNYQPIMTNDELIENTLNGKFLKIAVQVPLAHWNEATVLIEKHQNTIIGILADQLLPRR
jgi:hypothetical protein